MKITSRSQQWYLSLCHWYQDLYRDDSEKQLAKKAVPVVFILGIIVVISIFGVPMYNLHFR